MLPPLADLNDLATRIPGGIANEDSARAEAALEDASAEVRHAAGRTWADDDEPPPIAVRITLRVAKALFLNPHDYRSEQIGEYSYQRPSGGMLTELEQQQLSQLAGDLVSVTMQLPYRVTSPTVTELDSRRIIDNRWPNPALVSEPVDP